MSKVTVEGRGTKQTKTAATHLKEMSNRIPRLHDAEHIKKGKI